MLHAHWHSASRDCDGPFERYAVITAEPDEDKFDFARRMLAVYSPAPFEAGATLTIDAEYEWHWSAPTDEGFHGEHVQVCEDESCDLGERGQRDYYAEQMGY